MGLLKTKFGVSVVIILAVLSVVSVPSLMRLYALSFEYPHRVECMVGADNVVEKVFYIYPRSLRKNAGTKSLTYSAKKTDVPDGLDVLYKVSDRGSEFEAARMGGSKLQSGLACSSAEMLPKIVLTGNI